MTFRLIEAEKAQHPVSLLCSVLGVTRAGYYAWRQRGPSRRALGDAELASLIRCVFVESLETYGAPRVHAELREAHDVRVGRKRVARLMRQLELEGVSRRGKRRRTTIPDPAAAPAPDLVGRRFTASRPNELWLADITYLPTREGWLFLAVVLDAFSRRIVGWSMRDDLKAELVIDALGMAVTRRKPRRASSTTPTAARSTPRSLSAHPCASPAWWRAWAAAATPTTTPPARASSPRSKTS
jgi:putative transposase